jgi:hypothetical protein
MDIVCSSCGEDIRCEATTDLELPEEVFAICPVWPLDGTLDSIKSTTFNIPEVFHFGSRTDPFILRSSDSTLSWSLCGIVCRANIDVETGHYVAIVNVEGSWWLVDDSKLSPHSGPVDAFASGRTPVLLLYDKVTPDVREPGGRPNERTVADFDSMAFSTASHRC